jgi:hypothetical protein
MKVQAKVAVNLRLLLEYLGRGEKMLGSREVW